MTQGREKAIADHKRVQCPWLERLAVGYLKVSEQGWGKCWWTLVFAAHRTLLSLLQVPGANADPAPHIPGKRSGSPG